VQRWWWQWEGERRQRSVPNPAQWDAEEARREDGATRAEHVSVHEESRERYPEESQWGPRLGVHGDPRDSREDGQSHLHRMFRNVYTSRNKFPYFREVSGPWTSRNFVTLHAEAGDFTGDGVDDLIVCDVDGPAVLARQGSDGSFLGVILPKNNVHVRAWRSARIADVTGDRRPDLVVLATLNRTSFLRVFKGVQGAPYFDFARPYFEASLQWVASDVEVLDINQDGRSDIYVVQVDESKGKFCYHHGVKRLPPEVVPQRDNAHDILFLGTGQSVAFKKVVMDHAQPGCGNIAQRWDDRTMLLGQGAFDNPGYELLLEW
jgi:FG-GAP-like repeat